MISPIFSLSLSLQGGHSLPLRCHPTSSRPDGQKPVTQSKKSSSQKVKAPKQSGLRTKETIEHLTVTDQEPGYRPSPSSESYQRRLEYTEFAYLWVHNSSCQTGSVCVQRKKKRMETSTFRYIAMAIFNTQRANSMPCTMAFSGPFPAFKRKT